MIHALSTIDEGGRFGAVYCRSREEWVQALEVARVGVRNGVPELDVSR